MSSSTSTSSKSRRPQQQQRQQQQRFQLHRDIGPGSSFTAMSNQILRHHDTIRTDRPPIDVYLEQPPSNFRFPSIVCFDHTRYIFPNDREDRFYHANWVDGYRKKKQYLLATAPHTREKVKDFWQMILAELPVAIVIMNDAEEETRIAKRFWPEPGNANEFKNEGQRWIEIVNNEQLDEAADGSYQQFRLTLIRYRSDQTTRAETTLFVMKKDKLSVPGYFPQLRNVLSRLRKELLKGRQKKHYLPTEDKLVLVCGDGVTKNGNYCVFDIIMDRVVQKQQVGLNHTADIIRRQRYGTVSRLDQYRQLNGLLQAQLHDFGAGNR